MDNRASAWRPKKTPPCEQWEPPAQVEFVSKKGNKYCRNRRGRMVRPFAERQTKKTTLITRPGLSTKTEKSSCHNLPKESLKVLSKVFDLESIATEEICKKMNALLYHIPVSLQNIVDASELFGVRTKNTTSRTVMLKQLVKKVETHENKHWKTWLNVLKKQGVTQNEMGEWVVRLLVVVGLGKNIDVPVDDVQYNKLIQTKQREIKEGIQYLTPEDDILLTRALHGKLCRCLNEMRLEAFVESCDTETPKKRYGICTASIYNKRGFKAPSHAVSQCKK